MDTGEWQTAQWSRWLEMRDFVMTEYFDVLKEYVNLPASDRLVMRDLKKKLNHQLLKMTYTAVAPPENTIYHNWEAERPRTYTWSKEDEAFFQHNEEEAEGLPELESEPGVLPDDERVYRLLGQITEQVQSQNRFVERWSGVMTLPAATKAPAPFFEVLLLFSKGMMGVEGGRDALVSWQVAKAKALLDYGMKKMNQVSRLMMTDAVLTAALSPVLIRAMETLLRSMESICLSLANLPEEEK